MLRTGRGLDLHETLRGAKVTSDGKFLAVSWSPGGISMLNISATGGLTPITGSTFLGYGCSRYRLQLCLRTESITEVLIECEAPAGLTAGGNPMLKLTMILCVMSASLSAQWPNHPTPGMPRTPDGKPDLLAPAPRAADGKPDLSGVWMVRNATSLFYLTFGLKPEEMRPWAAALYKKREDNYRNDTDGIACLPPGPKAGIAVGNFPMKIIQTPRLIAFLYEYQTIFRQIFTDGRSLPQDPNPTWMGYSVGTWNADTLVVTTAGYNDRTTLDLAGHPHTEALRVTERYHRVDVGHIDLQVTFDDPKAYTRPWTVGVQLDLLPEGDLIEYICENERDKSHLIGKSGEEIGLPVEVLASYVGTYGTPPFPVVISLEGTRLMIDPGSGKIPLIAHSQTGFTMEGTGVEFVKAADGTVTGMIEHWNEGDRHFARKK